MSFGYPDNKRQWRNGDVVIHAADAKEPKMLMRVDGFTRDEGLAKCRYVRRGPHSKVYPNAMIHLLDPADFGLCANWGRFNSHSLEVVQSNFELCRIWNRAYTVGQRVLAIAEDGNFDAVTTGKASLRRDGTVYVTLKPGGRWSLRFVQAITEGEVYPINQYKEGE
jgi:hypothetical protein